LLVVGWDGADWELLDPMLAQGRLPNLEALIERGASARLATLKPMISPLIWTSIATGWQPDEHGILDFVRPNPDGGRAIPITAADRQAPALWNILSEAGIPVGVVAWWATWPAEEVNGFVISDRVAYQLGKFGGEPERGLVHPPEAWSWLAGARVLEGDVDFELLSRFVHLSREEYDEILAAGGGYENKIVHLRRLLASTLSYHRMTLDAWRKIEPEVVLTYYEGPDTISHLFAPYAPPLRATISEVDFVRFRDVVGNYYEFTDELLGELLAEAGPEANVVLCSDHGFKWGEDRPREASGVNTATAAWWHRDPGVLVAAGPDFRALGERRETHVLDLPPTLLVLAGLPPGERMPGRVLEWALTEAITSRERENADYVELLGWAAREQTDISGAADAEVVERLRALGYLAGPEHDEAQPTPPAEFQSSVLNLGTVLLEQDRPEEALQAYQRALELDPSSPGAWLKCAVAQHRLGLFEEALASNRKVIELGGSEIHRESASLGMAIAMVELGQPGEAMLLLEAATAHMPESFILWKTWGDIAIAEGQLEPSRQAYKKALEIEDDIEALNRLAALVVQLDSDSARAAELWQRSLRLDPNQPRVRDALQALGANTEE
jgi:tetratricopeptide (TPR) repeat protein